MTRNLKEIIEEHLDRDYLVDTLAELVRTPTDVPVGETLMGPSDPKVAHCAREIIQPAVGELGLGSAIVDEMNNVVCVIGAGRDRGSLLLSTYFITQHANLMADPYSGKVVNGMRYGWDEDCLLGLGASQNKGALAAVLTALKIVADAGVQLRGTLTYVANAEGRSSHACTEHIIERYHVRADGGVVCIGTEGRVSLGNRGRVDVYVTVRGRTAHSSVPWEGLNAIDGANEVMNRLQTLTFPTAHPELGAAQLTVYKMICSPIAPHTIPDTCHLTIDRRLLPGEDPDSAVDQIRHLLWDMSPYQVEVEKGVCMLPAEVDPSTPIAQELGAAHRALLGREAETYYPPWTFDAGYPCHVGIPTVSYGPSTQSRKDEDYVRRDEFIVLSRAVEAAKIYAYLILSMVGQEE